MRSSKSKLLMLSLACCLFFGIAACSSEKSDAEEAAEVSDAAARPDISEAEMLPVEEDAERVLFVLTSHGEMGDTGEETGYYLGEVSHPWEVLIEAGYEVDFVSPQGGEPPVDGFNLEDDVNKRFWENEHYRQKLATTMRPEDVTPSDYVAIHYAGGHGTMWDFAENEKLADIAATIYENGGVVSAVCHGPAGLVNITLSDGSYLVDGKTVSAFTNEEEHAVELQDVVPYLLEDKLKERGAIFDKAGLWEEHVVSDGRLVTGQNPASAKKVGEEVLRLLQSQASS